MMPGGIAVVTSGFPRRSETFLLNELLALDARGALAAVFATKPGDGGPLHPGCRRLLRRVEVLPGGSPSAQAASLLERLGARRVAGVHGYFAHRPAAVAAHAARARVGAPSRLLPHGVDTHRFRPRPAPRGVPLRLLAVGRLVEKKGFETLIEAAARLTIPFQLRIVGEGPRRARLARAIAAAGPAARGPRARPRAPP